MHPPAAPKRHPTADASAMPASAPRPRSSNARLELKAERRDEIYKDTASGKSLVGRPVEGVDSWLPATIVIAEWDRATRSMGPGYRY